MIRSRANDLGRLTHENHGMALTQSTPKLSHPHTPPSHLRANGTTSPSKRQAVRLESTRLGRAVSVLFTGGPLQAAGAGGKWEFGRRAGAASQVPPQACLRQDRMVRGCHGHTLTAVSDLSREGTGRGSAASSRPSVDPPSSPWSFPLSGARDLENHLCSQRQPFPQPEPQETGPPASECCHPWGHTPKSRFP